MPVDIGNIADPLYPPGVASPVVETFSPLALTNTFIERYGDGRGIQHMKLQKLAYYTHAWWLSRYEQPFLNERPQVWKLGPVFEEVYHDLKGFSWHHITAPQAEQPFLAPQNIVDPEVLTLTDWVWARYGGLTAEELSARTHAPGTPWRIIAERCNYAVPKRTVIDDDTIKQCFRGDFQQVFAAQ